MEKALPVPMQNESMASTSVSIHFLTAKYEAIKQELESVLPR